MKRLTALLLAVYLAGPVCGQGMMLPPQPVLPAPVPVPGQPFVQLPATASGQPGAFITIAATTNGKAVAWYSADPGLNLFPVELLRDSRIAIVTSTQAGNYRLIAFTALADQPARSNECIVTVGQPPPVPPPGPVPPGPTPPVPPNPTPDLARTLQAAFDRDDDPDKRESAATLAAIYKRAGTGIEAAGLQTLGQADAWVRDASFIALGGIRLPSTRDAIGRFMKEQMPGKAADSLDAAAKGQFKAACDAVASALGGLR